MNRSRCKKYFDEFKIFQEGVKGHLDAIGGRDNGNLEINEPRKDRKSFEEYETEQINVS